MTEPLLSIRNLQVQFRADSGWVTAVDDVSLDVGEGDCVGIVGESGSGKSVTALSILQLHDRGTTRMPSGSQSSLKPCRNVERKAFDPQ